MQKKITITIILTLIATLSLFCFAWGAITIVSPYSFGKMARYMNCEETASAYFELDYKRNKSDERLFNLTASMFYAKNYEKAELYGEELITRDSFDNLYTNKNYFDACIFVLRSKYYLKSNDLMDFLVEHTFHYEGEKIVDFDEYVVCLNSLMKLAKDNNDKDTLNKIKSTLIVEQKINLENPDIFADNSADFSDNIISDYELYISTMYILDNLLK